MWLGALLLLIPSVASAAGSDEVALWFSGAPPRECATVLRDSVIDSLNERRDPGARWQVFLSFEELGEERAVELRLENDEVLALERRFVSADCDELGAALALAIRLHIEAEPPMEDVELEESVETQPETKPGPSEEKLDMPHPNREGDGEPKRRESGEKPRPSPHLALGFTQGFGILPHRSSSIHLSSSASLSRDWGLQVSSDFARTAPLEVLGAEYEVTMTTFGAGLIRNFSPSPSARLLLSLGPSVSFAHMTSHSAATAAKALQASLGLDLRSGGHWAFWRGFGLGIEAGARAQAIRARYLREPEGVIWTQPLFGAWAGVFLGWFSEKDR